MKTIGIEFVASGEAGLCELGRPTAPEAGKLLVETKYTGVTNGTERHALLGEHGYGGGKYPSRHGYQHVGQVAAVGDAVTKFAVGDWVFVGQYVGHRGWNVVDENGLLIRIPDSLKPKLCALSGVAGVALRSVRRMGVAAGDNVWVVGAGPIGHFTAQAARAVGAKVTVTDVVARRLAAARAAGAHAVLDAGDDATTDALKAAGPYDYIYDCCSAEDLLFDIRAAGLLARGGTIGAMAVRQEVRYPWGLLHATEGRIETSCHFTVDTLAVLMWLYEQKLVTPEPMISHVEKVDRAPEIYKLLAERSEDLLGVIFEWE